MRIESVVCTLSALILAGCATLSPDFETPAVQVVSVSLLPPEDLAPRFAIGLRVMNPNRADLPLKGAAYTVHLEDREIITGVTNDLPTIPGYGEAMVTLNATLNWMQGLELINDLALGPLNGVSYEVKVKLDVGTLLPAIHITDSGTLSLDNLSNRNPT